MSDRLGLRAITMQQPFAAAMAAGLGLYTRRGKATSFAAGGEWVAVHCGQNDEHLKNASLMKSVRKEWPDCPSDAQLRSQQRCILGVVHMVQGDCIAKEVSKADFFLKSYECSKAAAWRADAARATSKPLPYPKGNLQVWHLTKGGFGDGGGADAESIMALAAAKGGAAKKEAVKVEAATSGKKRSASVKVEEEPEPKVQAKVKREAEAKVKREIADLGPAETYRPTHRGATVTARVSKGPKAPRKPLA